MLFRSIDDVSQALERLVGWSNGFEVFNIGTGTGTSIAQLIAAFRQASSGDFQVEHLPARDVDVPANVLDSSKFAKRFAWRPTVKLVDGIGKTLDWYRRAARGTD